MGRQIQLRTCNTSACFCLCKRQGSTDSQSVIDKNMLFVGVLDKLNALAHQPALCASIPINGDTQNHMTLLIGGT